MLKTIHSFTEPTTAKFHCQVIKTEVSATSTGGKQLVVEFADASAKIKLRFFDNHPWFTLGEQVPPNTCLEISGTFATGKFGPECKDMKSRQLDEPETAALYAGPQELRDKQDRDWKNIHGLIEAMPLTCPYRAIMVNFLADQTDLFRRAAAARGNHHARRGGLVEHVSFMMRNVKVLCENYRDLYPALDVNLALCATFFHDVGKLWENNYPQTGFEQEYKLAAEALGHIVIGIQLVGTYWSRLPEQMREDNKLRALQHLIASHHGTKEFGSPVEPACPEGVILHFVDNMDAKVNMMVDCIATGERLTPWLVKKAFPLERNLILFGTTQSKTGFQPVSDTAPASTNTAQ